MKKSSVLFVGLVALGLATINVAFKSPQDNKPQLTIINKTDSDIDHIHFIIGGVETDDLLDGGEDDILHPGGKETVEFDCSVIGNKKVTVKLIFEDGKSYSFDDDVCEGDFTWEIVDDGGHQG
jgi:hypothetical protein